MATNNAREHYEAMAMATRFVSAMNCHQFGHRDWIGARREAQKIGGQEIGDMSFSFPDGSRAYLSDQLRWEKVITDLARGAA